MANTICYCMLHTWQDRGIHFATFRNGISLLPLGIRADRLDCRNRKRYTSGLVRARRLISISWRFDRRRRDSAQLRVRSIDLATKRQPTANVNYHALFLFIDAREPHSHRVSVIKNILLALCLLKEKYLRGLKSEEKKDKARVWRRVEERWRARI